MFVWIHFEDVADELPAPLEDLLADGADALTKLSDMGHIRTIYGFYMVLLWDNTFHIKPICCHVLPLYYLFYGKDTYFVKFHTIPIYGNDMGYGNGMG